jgi:hypothetical protein
VASLAIMALAATLAACGTSDNGGATDPTAGWQRYTGAHFSLEHPPSWGQQTVALTTRGAAASGNTFVFYSPDRSQELAVAELDGLTATAIHNICGTSGTKTTIAGLPMIYGLTASGVRNYTFVSANNTGYTLISEGPAKQPDNQTLYDTIMGTFQPDTQASGCK